MNNYPLHILQTALFDINETIRIIGDNSGEYGKVMQEKENQLRIAIRLIKFPLDHISIDKKPRKIAIKNNASLVMDSKSIHLLKVQGLNKTQIAKFFNTTRYQVDKIAS